MKRTRIYSPAIAAGAAALLLAAGVPAHATTASPDTASAEQCAELTGGEALEKWGPELAAHDGQQPLLEYAETSGYDPCADLSWITVPYGESVSAPRALMLFHDGVFVKTATEEPIRYAPELERTETGSLLVFHPYWVPRDEEDQPRGLSIRVYSWSEELQTVQSRGQLPPKEPVPPFSATPENATAPSAPPPA